MIKIKSNKIVNSIFHHRLELEIRGETLVYSYSRSTQALDDFSQLESGDDSILTSDEQDTIDNLLTDLMSE